MLALKLELLGQGAVTLTFEVSNPRFTEKVFVNGTTIEIASPARRILIAPVIDVVPGTPLPTLDLSALKRFEDTPVKAGETFKVQIGVKNAGFDPAAFLAKWWWLILLLLLIAIAAYLMRRRTGP